MGLFGEQSDWSTIIAVGTVAIGGTLFVINQINNLRKEFESHISTLRKDIEGKVDSVKRNITRVEDETSRKIGTSHARIDKAEEDIKNNQTYLFDNILKLKDQLMEMTKK